MNNKYIVTTGVAPTYDTANNGLLRASQVDELITFSNDMAFGDVSGTPAITTDVFYIPENLTNFGTTLTADPAAIRYDAKRRNAFRLPQATVGQALFIISANDTFAQYFINSVVINTPNFTMRWGICNFTANQATNPLSDGNQSTLQALWSFFDINSAELIIGQ